ncbi:MAG: P1 family peptidase [Vulcanimicrobiota bacterium]
MKWILWLLLLVQVTAEPRMRARQAGIVIGRLPTGAYNAITDVPGVRVGQTTLWRGQGKLVPGAGPVRTGVTAVLAGPDPWAFRYPASAFVLNGNGEVSSLAYLQDIGWLESPILLTNTLNLGKVSDACVAWLIGKHPEIGVTDDVPIPVVCECDDSYLNDIQGRHVGQAEVFAALDGARSGPVSEGAVGAGTGMVCYEYKGGIGTSSRRSGEYHVGVLVNANHGSREELRVNGRPLEIAAADFKRLSEGSIILVVATDAPLNSSQLNRLARRAAMGLARTGSSAHHGSGDLVVAFSTANARPRAELGVLSIRALADQALDPLYQATVEAAEEAILNALCSAETTIGRDGHTVEALPLNLLRR